MLDDLKYIHEKDTEDALGIVAKQWQQVEQSYDLPKLTGKFQNIVHSGMGGSALWAMFTTSWPGYNVPFEIVRDYSIPPYVNDKTLFVASSYSGNTEEILTSIKLAEAKGAFIVVIASGGKLADVARAKGYPLALLPKIDKPRYAAFYGWRALIQITEQLGLLAVPKAADQLKATDKFLKQSIADWLPTVPTKQNLAKQIALELMGKTPVIYSGRLLAPAAHKWKISINENSKNVAFEYVFPEFNHNEFTGWTSHPTSKPFAIIYLKSAYDNARVKKRFTLSNKLLSGRWPAPIDVTAKGASELEEILWTVSLGDFVSIYLALLNGVNPIDTGDRDIIEKFKKELGSHDS